MCIKIVCQPRDKHTCRIKKWIAGSRQQNMTAYFEVSDSQVSSLEWRVDPFML